jgi:hypothetical protein
MFFLMQTVPLELFLFSAIMQCSWDVLISAAQHKKSFRGAHANSLCNLIDFVTELPANPPNININDDGVFKGKLRSQTVFEVPTDCYCTSVNTTWRTASLIHHHAEFTPTFFT